MSISFDDSFTFLFTVSGGIKEMTYDLKLFGHAHTTSVTMQMSPPPKLFPPKHEITLFLNKMTITASKHSLCDNDNSSIGYKDLNPVEFREFRQSLQIHATVMAPNLVKMTLSCR